MRSKDTVRRLAASLILTCAAPVLAAAEVRFTGNIDRSVLATKNATMSEIVSSMQSVLNCKIMLRGSTNQQFTGAYSGSLRHVLARLLERANYVVSFDRDEISIILIGADGARSGAQITQPGLADQTPHVQLAANKPASDIRGWTGQPSEVPTGARPPAGISLTPTVSPEPANSSGVQGWTGAPSELPAGARPPGTDLAAVVNPESANSPDVQGWTGVPSELSAGARAPATSLAAAVNPDPANSSDVEGWTGRPSELPPRANSL